MEALNVSSTCEQAVQSPDVDTASTKRSKQYPDKKDEEPNAAKGEALVSLPIELIDSIATFLTRNELAAFRATCRELAAKLQRSFAHDSFTSRKFLLADPWSMNALVEIARHPVFGKTLRTITLAPYHLTKSGGDYFFASKRYEHAIWARNTSAYWRDKIIDRAEYERIYDDQKKFWSSGRWQTLLAQAIANFAASGTEVTIIFDKDACLVCRQCGDPYQRYPACGEIRLERLCGWQNPLSLASLSSAYCNTTRLLRSLLGPGGMVSKVVMDQQWTAVPMNFQDAASERAWKYKDSSPHLTELDLLLHGPGEPKPGHGFRRREAEKESYRLELIDFIRHRGNLKRLVLRRGTAGQINIATANALLQAKDMPKLHSLELLGWRPGTDARLSLADLSTFLQRHSKTIRRLKITYADDHKADAAEHQAAADLYASVQAKLQLETFKIFGRDYVHLLAASMSAD
ncbi:hypothetical protein LTR27_008706 [Elasticomyces elasticus]|nr:hypothetical protein LTR27_008706 [Elasticomyces elasticus]